MAKIILPLILVLVCIRCKVPIQTAKITQIEHFEQHFQADDYLNMFEELLGKAHYDKIQTPFVEKSDILKNNMYKSIGNVLITVSVVPNKKDTIVIEGFGNYHIITDDSVLRNQGREQILYAGYFRIKPDYYSVKKMTNDNQPIKVVFEQYLVSYLAREKIDSSTIPLSNLKYFHKANVLVDIMFKKVNGNDKVISIDYSHAHKVSLEDGTKIGYMQFDSTLVDHKIIDLRLLKYVRTKY